MFFIWMGFLVKDIGEVSFELWLILRDGVVIIVIKK